MGRCCMLDLKISGTGRDCDAIVHEIAKRSAAATLSQLGMATEGMNVAELRGYVRAHAWPCVSAEVNDFDADDRFSNSQLNELAARALEQTVHVVTRAYLSAPVVVIPTPHIGRRAAA